MNPVWFIARKYISMGKKKWENFLKSVGVDIVVVGHDDHLPYMAYNGTLYGLDQSGRDRDYSLSHQERGERSDIFLFL